MAPLEVPTALGIPLSEMQRAHEEERLGEFIESMPAAVFVMDRQGQPSFSNRRSRALLGKKRRPGARWEDPSEFYDAYVAGTDVRYPPERMPIYRALQGESSSVDDIEIQHPGRRVALEVHGAPLMGRTGEVAFALAIFHDITERRQEESRRRIADRLASVGTLAAGVAHEINNPLTYVTTNLDFVIGELRGQPTLNAEALRALEEAREGAERVRAILQDLKTFSRPSEDAQHQVWIHKVLESALRIASPELRSRARLVTEVHEVPPTFANEARLAQVFLNLLENAAQSIPVGAPAAHEIHVSTSTDARGRPVMTVRDTGRGIPAANLPRIFEPFFTTQRLGLGKGLGLAICHGIIVGLGGELNVQTELGRGTRFDVVLPLATGEDIAGPALADAPVRAPSSDAPREVGRLRILVVDDEPMIGKAVRRILGGAHEVQMVSSARDALERVRAGETFDVLLSDLMMPEMSGMELHAELLASHPDFAERMVFITGGAFTEAVRSFLGTVANPHLEKPFRPNELERVLAAVRPAPA